MSDISWLNKAIALLPKPFAFMSMVGSLYIIVHVLAKPKRRSASFHRILLGLSAYDLISSVGMFLGTWPVPRDSPGVYLASGTDGTCAARGFFVQLTVGTPLYNASLATYYFLVASRGWKDHQIKKIEPALHAFPTLFSLGTATAAAASDSYRSSNLWCWIDSSKNAYRLAFFYVPIWCSIAVAAASMTAMYCDIAAQERRMARYAAAGTGGGRSRRIAAQGSFYVFTFFLAWIFPSWTRISQMATGSVPPAPTILMAVFSPWQGFLNCLVYFRPRYLRYRQKHPELGVLEMVRRGIATRFEPQLSSRKLEATREVDDLEQSVQSAQARGRDQPGRAIASV